jgi:hypothetical protein
MRWTAIAAASAFMLSGCVTDLFGGAPQELDFMQGCWVAGDSGGVNFRLRFDAKGGDLVGQLLKYLDDVPTEEARIVMTRDGSSAEIFTEGKTWTYARATPKADDKPDDDAIPPQLYYELTPPGAFGSINIWHEEDSLAFIFFTPSGGPIVEGKREACD